jgi:serine/threonine protein kinase
MLRKRFPKLQVVTSSSSFLLPCHIGITMRSINFDSWEVGSRYQLHERLGRGSYGEVVKATDQISGRIVAIKQMKVTSIVTLHDVMCTAIDENFLQVRMGR